MDHIQTRPSDLWGNWPLWSLEGELVRGVQDNSRMLRAIHQSVSSRLHSLQSELQRKDFEVYNEVHFDIDSVIDNLGRSVEDAIRQSSQATVTEIRRLAQYLSCSLDFLGGELNSIGNQLSSIDWSVSKLVDLSEQVLEVLRDSLANTARQYIQQGLLWFYQGELELSKTQLRKSLEHDSTNYLAHYHLGHIDACSLQWDQASRNFELASKCAQGSEERARSLSCWARACHNKGDSERAFELIQCACKLCSQEAIYLFEGALYLTVLDYPADSWDSWLKRAMMLDAHYFALALGRSEFAKHEDSHRRIIAIHREVAALPFWRRRKGKTVKLGTGLRTADDFRHAIQEAGGAVYGEDVYEDIMSGGKFAVAAQPTELELVFVTEDELCPNELYLSSPNKILDSAQALGMLLCPPEVGPQLRLQYMDQPKDERLIIGMKPIVCHFPGEKENVSTYSVFSCSGKCLYVKVLGRTYVDPVPVGSIDFFPLSRWGDYEPVWVFVRPPL